MDKIYCGRQEISCSVQRNKIICTFTPSILKRFDFLLQNCFRFLDDIFHKCLKNFDIKQFCDLIDSLDKDLKFIFKNPSRTLNFLDIQLKIVHNTLLFDIFYKPTNSLSYLRYSSSHPSHTRNNIALSLAKQIINIVPDSREKRLSELKKHFIERNHPPEIIDYTFTKCFQPKLDKNKDLEKKRLQGHLILTMLLI